MSVELRGITKSFGTLIANNDINFKVGPGEIHAILGENGAGKSTLMNILYGLIQPDSGEILIDGNIVKIDSPSDALASGIGMVHQHFMLIPVFTVAENVVLGHEKMGRLGVLRLDEAKSIISEISKEFGLEIDPNELIENLSVGLQQRVEVIRALIYEAKILILDEPTAVLTPQETDELLQIMRRLKEQGTSIIFITHKLREVREVADKITIIRRGSVVGSALPTASQEELANQMVGRPIQATTNKRSSKVGKPILSIANLNITDRNGVSLVKILSLDVCASEIVSIAGVQGNGQSELARSLLNLEGNCRGSIFIDGKEILGTSVSNSIHSGIAYIPESRELDGLINSFDISENLILDVFNRAPSSNKFFMNKQKIAVLANSLMKEFDIRAQKVSDLASSLSGGNKQKVVLARELSRSVKVVIASQPTRGLDVGSIEFVHKRLIAERDAGRAVLIFSTELEEVFALSDRIAVMYKGEIIDVVPPNISRQDLGLLMAGIKKVSV